MDIKSSLVISTYNNPEILELVLISLLRQRVMPSEIIIADDGSGESTKLLLDSYAAKFDIPFRHIWHTDSGFRLAAIRNKAVAAASGDYIIQIDGDVILDKNFIKDHLNSAESGYFVCGSRVMVDEKQTAKMRATKSINIPFSAIYNGTYLNTLRIGILRKYMAKRFDVKKLYRLRGCNMAFWRADFIAVNGYDENLEGWGHEDSEMVYRMYNYGFRKKYLKFGGVIYHTYHKLTSRENEQQHYETLNRVSAEKIKWCENGINKHL